MNTVITDGKIYADKWEDGVVRYSYERNGEILETTDDFNRKDGVNFIDTKGEKHCFENLENKDEPSVLV